MQAADWRANSNSSITTAYNIRTRRFSAPSTQLSTRLSCTLSQPNWSYNIDEPALCWDHESSRICCGCFKLETVRGCHCYNQARWSLIFLKYFFAFAAEDACQTIVVWMLIKNVMANAFTSSLCEYWAWILDPSVQLFQLFFFKRVEVSAFTRLLWEQSGTR